MTFTLYYITCVLDSVLRWLKPCIYLDTVLVICSNKPWSYSREVQLVYTFVAWIKGNYGLWSISIRIKHNGHDVVFHIVLTRECIMFCSVIIWIRPRKQLTRMLFFFVICILNSTNDKTTCVPMKMVLFAKYMCIRVERNS